MQAVVRPICPVLLCGGSGTRLWPLSRKSYPKQFARLTGAQSLFQAAAMRFSGADFSAPLVVTNADFRFIVTEQLAGAGIDAGAILIEPEGRNTAPAILVAALHLAAADPDALMLVAPSDHVLPDGVAFRAAVAAARPAAEAGRLVSFGIRPDRAETGYGWLELGSGTASGTDAGAPIPLARFIEKPDAAAAARMLAAGNFLWNAGIFLFSVRAILDAFAAHVPTMLAPVRAALAGARADLGFLRLAAEPWAAAEAISIDYAVMERATNLSVMPYAGAWSDLGDWVAVWRQAQPGPDGNATAGNVTAIDCDGSLLRSETEALKLVGIGLQDMIAVAMADAVIVAPKSRAQDVRTAVAAMKAEGALQAETFPRDHRPWGWFETLILAERFQVKRIVVHPGAALSLQSHRHRSEHWVVVEGTARVTVGDEVRLLDENQSVHVPLGARHRLENPGTVAMVLIEVQTGDYLGEDDIIRHDDIYARTEAAGG